MKIPNTLSDKELIEYADYHICYEIDMLYWSTSILISIAESRGKVILPQIFNNIALEAFAIHSRNLIDFLYLGGTKKDQPTDIIVQDYLEYSIIERYLPPISQLLLEAKVKANKQAAHLTVDRIQYEKSGKGWKYLEILSEIMGSFSVISTNFTCSTTGEIFRDKIIKPIIELPRIELCTGMVNGLIKEIGFKIN